MPAVAATSTATFLFCDLVDSTARHARLGEDAADHFRADFFACTRAAVEASGGEVIKTLGDGLLVVFRRSTVDALHCAHQLHQSVTSLDPADPVRLRVGVSAGEAAEEDGDWFGMPVIEASRLCAAAAAGTTLASGIVRALAGSRGSHHFTSLGPKELKGIPQPVELWQVDRDAPAAAPPPVATPLRPRRPRALIGIGAVGVLLAVLAVVWVATRDDDAKQTGEVTTLGVGTPLPTPDDSPDTTIVTSSLPAPTTPSAEPAVVTAPVGYAPVLADRDCALDPLTEGVFGIECWTLTVPENRSRPQRSIQLHGYNIPASQNPATAPTIIDLGPSTRFANVLSNVANTVMIPSRGWGLSEPGFDCAEVDEVVVGGLALPSGDSGVTAAALEAVGKCRDRLIAAGFDLGSYNMEAEIGDVTDYLVAAGVSQALITTTPEDTPAALVAADRYPGTFTGIFLQNPVDPGSSWQADPVRDGADAYARYVAFCMADTACATAYPTLANGVEEAFAAANQAPQTFDVTANPVHVRNYPPIEPQQVKVYVDGPRTSQAILNSLVVAVTYPFLADAVTDRSGVWAPIVAAFVATGELGSRGGNTAAALSYRCAARPRLPGTADASAAAQPEFAAADDAQFREWCKVWNVPSLPPEFTSPSQGKTPTFIAVGALQPGFAIRAAESLARYRPNTSVITFATLGAALETQFGVPCYRDLLAEFVTDPTATLAVVTCAAQSPPIAFQI